MSTSIDLRALARRVAGRVLAERGASEGGVERAAGVHVTIESDEGPARPSAPERARAPGRGRELVTADLVAKVASGGELRVAQGSIVTDLALDEARRRGVRIVDAAASGGGRLRVAIASDHGGFQLKASVLEEVRGLGHEVFDLGTRDENAVDYPDYARAVAEAVAKGNADLGIAIDGAGIGSAMAANKVPGVRAAPCWSVDAAKNAREHNFANVLTLGARMLSARGALEILRAFLATPTSEERHRRRIDKITAIERSYSKS